MTSRVPEAVLSTAQAVVVWRGRCGRRQVPSVGERAPRSERRC